MVKCLQGLVKVLPGAIDVRNFTQCDSLLIGDQCGAHTFPYVEAQEPSAQLEHEATTSKVSDDQLFYLRTRGMSEEDALNMVVTVSARKYSKNFRWSLRSKPKRCSE